MRRVSRLTALAMVLTLGLLLPRVAPAQRLGLSGIYGVSAGGTGFSSTTANQLLYSPSANVISGLATANNGVLVTSGTGVPSISSTLPSATQDNITRLGTIATATTVSSPNLSGGVLLTLNNSATLTPWPGAYQRFSTYRSGSTYISSGLVGLEVVTDGHPYLVFKVNTLESGGGNETEKMRLTDVGNLGLATTSFGTSAAGVVALGSATAPSTSPADVVQVYATDVGGAGTFGLHIRDEPGNVYKLGSGSLTSVANLTPGANFTLTQNSVAALTSEETGAVVNTLYLKAGNVGIAVAAGAAQLHAHTGATAYSTPTGGVQGDFLFTDYAGYSIINLVGNTASGAGVTFGDTTDADYGSIVQFGVGAGEGGRMRFVAGTIETMNLKGGNVGIATSTFGTNAAGVLALGAATAPSTSPADVVQQWAADVDGAGTFGKFVRGEVGDVWAWGNSKQRMPAFVFANIATVLTTNGEIGYCSDCTIANPCAGAGTGAIAKRLNGANVCN